MGRARALAVAVGVAGALASAPEVVHAASVSVQGDVLVIRGDAGDVDLIAELSGGSIKVIKAVGGNEALVAGPGCTYQPPFGQNEHVLCPAGGLSRVDVDLGDGSNSFAAAGPTYDGLPRPTFPLPVGYRGGSGPDLVTALDQPSALDGGGGDDNMRTGTGSAIGGPGNDQLSANGHGSTVDGGEGNDFVGGGDGSGSLTIVGGGGNDYVGGSRGDDTIDAGPGDDEIDESGGNDVIDAGDGNDKIFVGDGTGDRIACGAGQDNFGSPEIPMGLIAAVQLALDCPPLLIAMIAPNNPDEPSIPGPVNRRGFVTLRLTASEAARMNINLVTLRGLRRLGTTKRKTVITNGPVTRRRVRIRLPRPVFAAVKSKARIVTYLMFTATDASGERYVNRRTVLVNLKR